MASEVLQAKQKEKKNVVYHQKKKKKEVLVTRVGHTKLPRETTIYVIQSLSLLVLHIAATSLWPRHAI